MPCNCGGYVVSTPCEISASVCKNSYTMISISSSCTYVLQEPSHGTVELSTIGSQHYIVYTNNGTGTTDTFSYIKTCNGVTTTCEVNIEIIESEYDNLEIYTLTANNSSCPLGGTALYTWTIPDCAVLLPGYTIHDKTIRVYVYPYNPELSLDENICTFRVDVCCSLPSIGICETCCECQIINYYPPICVGECQDEECYCPYPCTYWDENLKRCIFECEDYDFCCTNEGNINLNISLACGLDNSNNQIISLIPSLLNGSWHIGFIDSEETSAIDYNTGVINPSGLLAITTGTNYNILWSFVNSQLKGTILNYDDVNWTDISSDIVFCYKKLTSCGELTVCKRLVYDGLTPSAICSAPAIHLENTLPNDTPIVQNSTCYGIISYFCADECCTIEDCIINPDCTLNPICEGGECKCLLNGQYVDPLPNGCCPECIDGEPVPGCTCCNCVNGVIIYPPICPPNFVLNPVTCLCDCNCAGGYCRDYSNPTPPANYSCVPCPVCIPPGSSIVPCEGVEPPSCPLCHRCELVNGIYDCVQDENTCPPGYTFNPNPTGPNDCCIRTDCVTASCEEDAPIYCPEIPGCTCYPPANNCIPCSVIPCITDEECPYGCRCNEEDQFCEGNPCDTIEVNCEVQFERLENDLILSLQCGSGTQHRIVSNIIPATPNDAKWYISISNLSESWLEVDLAAAAYGVTLGGTNNSELLVDFTLLGTNFYLVKCIINGRAIWYQVDGVANGNLCNQAVISLGGVYLCNYIYKIDTAGWTVVQWHFNIDGTMYTYNPNTAIGDIPINILYIDNDEFVYQCSGSELILLSADIENEECEISTCEQEIQCDCTGANPCKDSNIVFSENFSEESDSWEISAKVIVPAGTPGYPTDVDTIVTLDCELLSNLQTCIAGTVGNFDDVTSFDCCLCGIRPVGVTGLHLSGTCNKDVTIDDDFATVQGACDDILQNNICNCSNPEENNNCTCPCGWTYDSEGLELVRFNGNNIEFNIIDRNKAKVCFQADIFGNSEDGDACCKCNCLSLPPENCIITADAYTDCVERLGGQIVPTLYLNIHSNYGGPISINVSQGTYPSISQNETLVFNGVDYSANITIPLVTGNTFYYDFNVPITYTITHLSQTDCIYSNSTNIICCVPEFDISEILCEDVQVCQNSDVILGYNVCLSKYVVGVNYGVFINSPTTSTLYSIIYSTGPNIPAGWSPGQPLCKTFTVFPNNAVLSGLNLSNFCSGSNISIGNITYNIANFCNTTVFPSGTTSLSVRASLDNSDTSFCVGNIIPIGNYCEDCYQAYWAHVGSDISKWNTPTNLGYFNYNLMGMKLGNQDYPFNNPIYLTPIVCASHTTTPLLPNCCATPGNPLGCTSCTVNPTICISPVDIEASSTYNPLHFNRVSAIAAALNNAINNTPTIMGYFNTLGINIPVYEPKAVPPGNNSVTYADNTTIIQNTSSLYRYIVVTTEKYESGLITGYRDVNNTNNPKYFGSDGGCTLRECGCDIGVSAQGSCNGQTITIDYIIDGDSPAFDVIITGCGTDYTATHNNTGSFSAIICDTGLANNTITITVTDTKGCQAVDVVSVNCNEDTCSLEINGTANCEVDNTTTVIVTITNGEFPVDVTVCGETQTATSNASQLTFNCTGLISDVLIEAIDSLDCEESIIVTSSGECCEDCIILGTGWTNTDTTPTGGRELCIPDGNITNNYNCTNSTSPVSGYYFNYVNKKIKEALEQNLCDVEIFYTFTPSGYPVFHHNLFTTYGFGPSSNDFPNGDPPNCLPLNYQYNSNIIYPVGISQPTIQDFKDEVAAALTDWGNLFSSVFNLNVTFTEVDYFESVNGGPISSSNLPKANFYIANANTGTSENILAFASTIALDISPDNNSPDENRSYGGYFIINPNFQKIWATEETQINAPSSADCASASPCTSVSNCFITPITNNCVSIKYNSYNIKYKAIHEFGHIFNLRHQGFYATAGTVYSLNTTQCGFDYVATPTPTCPDGTCTVHTDGNTAAQYPATINTTLAAAACLAAHPNACLFPTELSKCACYVNLTATANQYISGEDCKSYSFLGVMDNKVTAGENVNDNGTGGPQPFNGSLVDDAYCTECIKKRYIL